MFKTIDISAQIFLPILLRHKLCPEDLVSNLHIKRIVTTQNSQLFVISGDGLCRPILVKKLLNGNSKKQYDALNRALRLISDSTCRTPKPIAFDAKENILLMEYIEGQTVLQLLQGIFVGSDNKKTSVAGVGRWLARFHMNTRRIGGSVEAERRLEGIESRLRAAGSLVKTDRIIGSAWHYMQSQADTVDRLPVSFCATHGDCKPENFIVSDNNIVGIDLDMNENGLPLMDVAQFANHIMFLSLQLPGLFYAKQLGQWVDNFLDAYRQEQNEYHGQLLRWLRTGHYLRYWATEKIRGGLVGRSQSLILKQLIARDLRDAR